MGNGKTLLETQLEGIIKSKKIDEVIIVIGYLADQIEAKINRYKKNGLKITLVYNPFYEMSNNLISLWLSKEFFKEDFLITNGDNIFHPHVFSKLIEKTKKEGIFLTISKKEEYDTDDMKVLLSDNNVIEVSKDIKENKANAESVGLALVKGKKYREIFNNTLDELVKDKKYLDKYWLEVFNQLNKKCVSINPFEIDGKKEWSEIDFHYDLEYIKKLVKAKIENLEL